MSTKTDALASTQPTRLTIMGRWNRPVPGGFERMSTIWQDDAPGGVFEGQIAYLAADPNPGERTELRRYYNPFNGNHMDSAVLVDPAHGYVYEGPHGYVWNAPLPGAARLHRWLRPSPFDHASAHTGERLTGYVDEGGMGYVFPRYLNFREQMLELSAGEVTIKSNLVAGGAIWEWHQGGFQYVNDFDYGRQIQGAIFIGVEAVNPTEAGDRHTTPQDRWKHGSPLIGAFNAGATQTTLALPLQWSPDVYGGDATHPVVWLGYRIGKEITLNFNGMPRVARYVTRVTVPTLQPSAKVAIPALFSVAALNRYYVFDVQLDELRSVTVRPDQECTYPGGQISFENSQWHGAGAGILADPGGTRAIGIYGRTEAVSRFFLVDGAGGPDPERCGLGTGQFGQQFSAVNAEVGPIALPAGTTSFTTYIASGTLAQVRSDFRALFAANF